MRLPNRPGVEYDLTPALRLIAAALFIWLLLGRMLMSGDIRHEWSADVLWFLNTHINNMFIAGVLCWVIRKENVQQAMS